MECVAISLFLALIGLIWLAVRPFVMARGWRELARQLDLSYTPGKGFLGIPTPERCRGPTAGVA